MARTFPDTFPGEKEGAMTGMRSPDGYGKRRVGTEREELRGAREEEGKEGNALPGKAALHLKKPPPSSGGAPDLQPAGSQPMAR